MKDKSIFSGNGYAVELNNCLTEARQSNSAANGDAWMKIRAAADAGQFVVVEEFTRHCRSTDAIAGTGVAFRGAFATRELAMLELNRIGCDNYDDSHYFVFPIWATIPAQVVTTEDDGVPF